MSYEITPIPSSLFAKRVFKEFDTDSSGSIDGAELVRLLDLRHEDEVAAVLGDEAEVFEPLLALVDADHPLGGAEVDLSQGVAHEHTRRSLGRGRDRVLEVEDDPIRTVQPCVHHVLGLVTREIEP